jgi:hypothetical protein
MRAMPLLILIVLLSVPPVAMALHKAWFEKRRWSESDFGGGGGDDDDDGDDGSGS